MEFGHLVLLDVPIMMLFQRLFLNRDEFRSFVRSTGK